MISRSKFTVIALLLFYFGVSNSKAFTPIAVDSIGVERKGDKLFILHKVTFGETLFSISRRYQVSVEVIKEANEVLKQGLKSGQTIRIPKEGILPPSENSYTSSSVHKVASGETLFSISKKYGVTVELLQQWNNLSSNSLKAGQSLVIKESKGSTETPVQAASYKDPTESVEKTSVSSSATAQVKHAATTKEAPTTSKTTANIPNESKKTSGSTLEVAPKSDSKEWIYHTVKSGETLFSITGEYGKNVEDLIQWNSLSSNNLKSGQVIKIAKTTDTGHRISVNVKEKKPAISDQIKLEPIAGSNSGGFKNITETGLAQVIEGTGGHKKYLVLHRKAPIGSVIRIKNEENNLIIFARVVGTLPETGDNSKLVVMLSQAAFDQLKAVNSRFPVEILY